MDSIAENGKVSVELAQPQLKIRNYYNEVVACSN